jgi:molybdopterin-guanine dinucleotide biosynthesis protein A
MDAIVTAGGIPTPEEPLYEFTQGQNKALLDIAGKPMVQWVLDALEKASLVNNVVIVGLSEDSGVYCSKIAAFLPNQGGMLNNIRFGAEKIIEINPQVNLVLSVSSDTPAVTAEMVDWLVSTAQQTEHEVYYNIITREVMETRFPTSKRSYVRLKEMEVCGGDMNAFRARAVLGKHELWEKIIASRKSPLKQAALVGFDTLFLLLTRSLTVQEAEKKAVKRLGLKARALLCPYAEIGMDVDKPHQLQIMREELSRLVVA